MNSPLLYSYIAGRSVQRQDRIDIALRCSVDDAIRILAVYLENKAIAMPQESTIPRLIHGTYFYICRLTPDQLARRFWPRDTGATWWQKLETLWLMRPVLRWRMSLETAVAETTFEIVHLPALQSHASAGVGSQQLAMVQMRFMDVGNGTVYLRIFSGWDDAMADHEYLPLFDLLAGYRLRIEMLFGQAHARTPEQDASAAGSDTRIAESRESKATLSEADEAALPDEPLPAPTAAEDVAPKTAAAESAPDAAPTQGQSRQGPRIYKKSLLKICRLAARRQAAIADNKPIPNLWLQSRKHGPSKNTLAKVANLVTNWHERDYVWDVAVWLHEHSAHSEDEVTDRLTYLRSTLSQEEWQKVRQAHQ